MTEAPGTRGRILLDLRNRTADPYHDTDVIDSRAPRVNQAVIGALALTGVVTGQAWLLGLLALQLALGLCFLASAAILRYAGAEIASDILGLLVAALALTAATTGLCMGCEFYKLT